MYNSHISVKKDQTSPLEWFESVLGRGHIEQTSDKKCNEGEKF